MEEANPSQPCTAHAGLTGGTSKEIMSSILPLKRPTDYLTKGGVLQKSTANTSQRKLAFTGEICKWLCEFGGARKIKNQARRLFRPKSIYLFMSSKAQSSS
jgi:hypothetical protein